MRYGFVLADVHRGTSNSFGPAVTSLFPEGSKDTLIILPGGRLNKATDSEFLRNSIYDFANRENLDAAVVWVSSLTEVQDTNAVAERLEKLEAIPRVTIGGGNRNILYKCPDVSFDGYGGMNSIVSHCIEHHGAKRIAFLRGPERHLSSEDRYEAYKDALLAHGLVIDETLISSPHAWNEGREGMLELLDDRGLVPGKDFDTLITASDFMLFKAYKLMEERGYDLDPSVFRFCGFNDSSEAKVLSVPCTTVRLPYRGIAEKSFSILQDLQQGKKVAQYIRLGVKPIFRKSCGCQGFHLLEDTSDPESFLTLLAESSGVSVAELRPLLDEARKNKDERTLRKLIRRLCNHSEDLYAINEAIESIPYLTFLEEEERKDFYQKARYLLPEEFERAYIKRMENTKKITDAVSDFKIRLLRGNSLKDINRILQECASSLGLTEAYLVMSHPENHVLIGQEDREFPSSLLLPKDILDSLKHAVYVVVPLYTEDEVLGHLVLGITNFNGTAYEEIRSAVSSAVRSSLLFEQTNLAKESAEKVEYDRTVFFSSVNDKLRQPIHDIERLVSKSGSLTPEDREQILSILENTHRVMDLALSKTSELDMDFQLGDFNTFLHHYAAYVEESSLPCLFFDERRLDHVLSDLLNDNSRIKATLTRKGVRLVVEGAEAHLPDADYAERILLLHGGSFHLETGESVVAEILLPYPTLSNKSAGAMPERGVIATFGDMGDWKLEGLEKRKVDATEFLSTKTLPLETVALWWSPEFTGDEAKRCLQLLEADDSFVRLPFLSIGLDKGRTLAEAVQKSFGPDAFRILVCGGTFDPAFPWLQHARIATSDMEEAFRKVQEMNPSLVFLANDDGRVKDETIVSFLQDLHNAEKTASIPVLVSMKTIEEGLVEVVQDQPKTILATSSILANEDFSRRVTAIIGGAPILPVYSGAIVKKAEAYLYKNYMKQISRWQIAEAVHVSEDYLTSVFKKEIGISPWDYLNRLRIEAAVRLLKETGMTMADVAKATGFQGQAYFCTVFKKIKGISPSAIRKKN